MNKFYFSILLLFTSSFLFAQPVVQDLNGVSAENLATLIMGEQATVSNASITCPNEAGGVFMEAEDLGFTNGVILTSGSAALAFTPNNIGSASRSNGAPGDEDLENYPWSYVGTFDACALEFDFVPVGNQISFSYVFGSEEYPEWVGSNFNDAFGIFLEGGPEYPAETPIEERNIAIIPNTNNIYVAINFLNGSVNDQLFVSNTGGQHIQYDGYTVPLPATANVTPGITYHLKIVIADVSDAIYDSGIFIALDGEDILVYKTLNILAFWDENGNNLQDEGEIPLNNQAFVIEPNNKVVTTDSEGQVSLLLLEGEHQLGYQENTLWEMTTPTTYDINIQESTELPTYSFALQPSRILHRVEPYLSSNPTRCNSQVSYYLDYSNTGTTIANGIVSLEFDDLMEFVEAYPQPDVIEAGKLSWNIEGLYPSHQNQIQLRFGIPDENFIGEILETHAVVQLFNDNEEFVYSKSNSYNSEVRCSFDPNDKLTQSNLLGQSEFAYLGDTILYTIRFQNTGNDVAFHVRVEDFLDKKLDWTTFHPITSSHDFSTSFNRSTGKAIFDFEDIMLPDHITNEPESHGFVMFGIVSLPDIEDKTEVNNTASIFFDENPPIVTNMVANTLIEQVETDIETLNSDYSIRIFPNPFSDFATIEVNGLSAKDNYRLEMMDILGRKVRELKSFDNGEWRIERGDLESGLYLIRVLEEENRRILGSEKILIK